MAGRRSASGAPTFASVVDSTWQRHPSEGTDTAVSAGMEADLEEQPAVLARLLEDGRAAAETAAAAARARGMSFAVMAARGSSDNAARYGQYVLGARQGLTVALAAPSLVTRYGARPRMEAALAIGLSQSGQSPDVVAVLAEARRQGAVTVAITNDPRSPLADTAAHVLPLGAGLERAVPATKTYTAQLLALAMLSAALGEDAGAWRELDAVPERVARTLTGTRAAAREAARALSTDRLLVLGRGYNLATAFEVALKVKEACGVWADPYSTADFAHGPVALAEAGLPVVVIAAGPVGGADAEESAARARERGARLIAISDRPALLAAADVALGLPPDGPEWLSPIEAVVPGQLFTWFLAQARGLSPDAPRGLSKVTLTR